MQNDKMISINSAIAVDLTGQVCADSIGSRLYSGVGGQVDFVKAGRSKGACPSSPSSTAKNDTVRASSPCGARLRRYGANDVHYGHRVWRGFAARQDH